MEAAALDPVAERLRALRDSQREAKARANALRKEIKHARKAIQKTKGMTADDLFAAARRAEAAEAAAATPR